MVEKFDFQIKTQHKYNWKLRGKQEFKTLAKFFLKVSQSRALNFECQNQAFASLKILCWQWWSNFPRRSRGLQSNCHQVGITSDQFRYIFIVSLIKATQLSIISYGPTAGTVKKQSRPNNYQSSIITGSRSTLINYLL